MMNDQVEACQKTLNEIRSNSSSSDEAAKVVLSYLT